MRTYLQRTVFDCGRDSCKFDSQLENDLVHFDDLMTRQCVALSSVTHHTMNQNSGGRRGTECLNTKFHLFPLLYIG